MGFSGVLLALTAVKAVSEIGQGFAQKAESNFNATLAEGRVKLIGEQQNIEFGQFQQLKGDVLSESTANVAAAGIKPTGSAMAVMLEAQRQINIDQAIGQFNLEQEKIFARNEGESFRRKGKRAVGTGFSNAFSTLLRGASNQLLFKGGIDTSAGAKSAGKI